MTNKQNVQTREIKAAVIRKKGGPFQIETLTLEEPRPDEVLVRIVATGMCHTDMVARDQLYAVPMPVVLGHEGAGVVEQSRRQRQENRGGRPCRADLYVVRPLQTLPARRSDLLRELLPAEFRRRTRRREYRHP